MYKNYVFTLTGLNFSHLLSTFHLMQYVYWDVFFTAQKVFELVDCDAFQCFCLFLFHLLHISKMFPFEDFFSWGKQKSAAQGRIGWVGVVGHGGHAVFGEKLLNIQHSVGRCAGKSPIMKQANVLKESSKKFHWSWMQPLPTPPAGTLIQMGS